MKLNELPRYDIGFSEDGYEMGLELNGGWVRYSDAKNAIFALQAHVAELKAKIDGMIERPVVEAVKEDGKEEYYGEWVTVTINDDCISVPAGIHEFYMKQLGIEGDRP